MADDLSQLRAAIRDAIALLCADIETPFFNPFGAVPLPALADRMSKGQERFIVATGSYVLDEWQPGDDVRLVVLSKATQRMLWAVVAEKLDVKIQDPNSTVIELSASDLAMTTRWQPSALARIKTLSHRNKGDCKFYLHYCRLPATFDPKTSDHFPSHDVAQTSNFNLVMDTQIIAGRAELRVPPSINQRRLHQVRRGYRSLRSWAKEHGVLSEKVGFLNSDCLIWLVHKAVRESDDAGGETSELTPSAPDSFVGALETFHRNETEQSSMKPTTEQLSGPLKQLEASLKDPITAKDIHSVQLEIRSPTGRLVSGDVNSTNAIAIQTALQNDETLEVFMQYYKHYLKIDFTTWETSTTSLEHLYSTAIPQLMKKVASIFPCKCVKNGRSFGTYLRIWPDPIAETDGITYVAGLYRNPTDESGQNGLSTECLSSVKDQISDMEQSTSFPANSSFNISFISGQKLRAYLGQQTISVNAVATTTPADSVQSVADSANPSGRFRTAGQTISRLRYDQSHTSIEYDVGYMDRFDGLVWMGLENFGKAVEEEDFVPEHRVKLVKRRGDDLIIWDRENRVDRT